MEENKTLSASEIEAQIQLGIANLVQRALVNDMVALRLRLQSLESEVAAMKAAPAAN